MLSWEAGGWKIEKALEVVVWLKSEGVPIDEFGMQWHINVSTSVAPGDMHYQIAQCFINENVNVMVTELRISVPMRDGSLVNSDDLERQAALFRSMLRYILHFSSHSPIFGTWSCTDRYN
ncbi:unnamed protein product [Adineta ricciae]|uniref:GH10 domain-containing protein n=1 Tax=Adineta ricciae TaxID=249248 RepID=A0A814Q6V5_ADIRI|nr:unnamed protein product [Adineta ricciae]CAF1227122.1 unnamed protein product [Adineta ricciae]